MRSKQGTKSPASCIDPGNGRAMSEPLVRVNELVKNFAVKGGVLGRAVDQVHAVDHVSGVF